jgi:predicted GIY-YIG superfamily endonuclease
VRHTAEGSDTDSVKDRCSLTTTLPPDAPAAPTPLERYRKAVCDDELPWRPNTRRYRLQGAVHMADLDLHSSVLFMHLVWADKKPQCWDELAGLANISSRRARVAFDHLESHGWIIRDAAGWHLDAGLDCDCPGVRRAGRATEPPPPDIKPGFTALYRLYDAAGVLLYIGITDDLRARMDQHSRDKDWWPEVARRTVAWYREREDADRAETLAVAAEKPIHNKAKLYMPVAAVEF